MTMNNDNPELCFCVLLKKNISHSECYEINMENIKAVKPENIKIISRQKKMTFDEIYKTCNNCEYLPF
jgi:hypothetical protein